MRICTFCGHSKLSATYTEVKGALQSIVPRLMQEEGYDCFLVGNYGQFDRLRFDDVIVPALEDVPYQYRIVRANEYMVDRAETVIAYVNTPIGGAAKTLAYAKRKKKRIFYLVNNTVNSNRDGSSK